VLITVRFVLNMKFLLKLMSDKYFGMQQMQIDTATAALVLVATSLCGIIHMHAASVSGKNIHVNIFV